MLDIRGRLWFLKRNVKSSETHVGVGGDFQLKLGAFDLPKCRTSLMWDLRFYNKVKMLHLYWHYCSLDQLYDFGKMKKETKVFILSYNKWKRVLFKNQMQQTWIVHATQKRKKQKCVSWYLIPIDRQGCIHIFIVIRIYDIA